MRSRATAAPMPMNGWSTACSRRPITASARRGRGSTRRVATGFHRNTMVNEEGGTDDEEFRVAAIVDRLNTTLQVWMGTTIACAQCHDHKYDPFTQREYFQLFAFFNNTADRGGSKGPEL